MPNKNIFPNPEGLISFATYLASANMEKHYNKKLKEKNIEINLYQWGIIYRLFKFKNLNKKELSSQLIMESEKITQLLDDLEAKKLILKKNNLLFLTESGKKLIGQAMPIMLESMALFIKDIPPEHMVIAVNVLNRISYNINPEKELYQLNTPPRYIELDN